MEAPFFFSLYIEEAGEGLEEVMIMVANLQSECHGKLLLSVSTL